MFYFFSVLMYYIDTLLLCYYFHNKINFISRIIILFNLQISLFFIYLNYSFFYGLLLSILSIIFYKTITFFQKNEKEIVLIQDGNVFFRNVVKYYSYLKLSNYLKIHHLRLDEIAYCLKKNNHLITIKSIRNGSLPVSLILDGEIKEENLKLLHKDVQWFKEELLRKHLSIKNINYAYYRNNKIYYVM